MTLANLTGPARDPILNELQDARDKKRAAHHEWLVALERAILVGKYTEREIARAAGITGPAVHQRKAAMKGDA